MKGKAKRGEMELGARGVKKEEKGRVGTEGG